MTSRKSGQTALVTGGAGYIGSHVAYRLLEAGWSVVVLDDLSRGYRCHVPQQATFVRGDAGDVTRVSSLLEKFDVDAVLHFAGRIVVSESVRIPLEYYAENVAASRGLIEACLRSDIEMFVFSSTAGVYGIPDQLPVDEESPLQPCNPYGRSKLAVEWMLRDVAQVEPMDFCALRYFNVAGADPAGRSGQSGEEATHLIKVAAQAATGRREGIEIYGTDYATRDGTCIRDFIHVTDLAEAHLQALDHLADGGESRVFNCGYGRGYSVREVIQTVKAVSGVDFAVTPSARRSGDPPRLVADATRLRRQLGWQPEHDDLEEIVETALAWEQADGASS